MRASDEARRIMCNYRYAWKMTKDMWEHELEKERKMSLAKAEWKDIQNLISGNTTF